jgi:phosphatidylglycerophosphatase A
MKKVFIRLIATTFFSGYFPVAPGTVGSAIALIIWLILPKFRDIPLLLCIGMFYFLGVWVSGELEKIEGRDASLINIDEAVGMWISLLFLPHHLHWFWWLGAFFIFRFFDIVKPFPINRSQNLPDGWGVMMDDVLAGIYTNITLHIGTLLLIRS